jgi:excisionase family DNA binding protein
MHKQSTKVAFTIKEAASASGLSRSSLYVAIGRGALRARKSGGRTLIIESDLKRFLISLPSLSTGARKNALRGRNFNNAVAEPAAARIA